MQQTKQVSSPFPSNHSASPVEKRKTICKPQKSHLFQKSFRRGYSFSKVKSANKHSGRRKLLESTSCEGHRLLSSIYSHWVQPGSKALSLCISSFLQRFPTLPSVDQLFSLSTQLPLDSNPNLDHLLRYAKICSLLEHPDSNPFLLSSESQAGVIIVKKCPASQHPQLSGMLLTKFESNLCQRRQIFMNRLRSNELKYDASLGRMSQVSRELAFSYRIYLQTRNQISHQLNRFFQQSAPIDQQIQLARSTYARLQIGKYLRHTFEDCQLDQLNYFKLREYIESGTVEKFQSSSSFQQFQKFLKKRRPRRVQKYALATACSVCLSDYYQLSNPLRHCQGCGLRAHTLCFSFEHKKCGYCNYQRLEKQVKQQVEWCLICRKAGLMVIKIDELHYAHGFCLLVHGFWTIKARPNLINSAVESDNQQVSVDLNGFYENRNFNQEMEIEFKTPQKESSNFLQQNYGSTAEIGLEEHSLDLLQPSLPDLYLSPHANIEKWESQLQKNKIRNQCNICGISIFHNLSITCSCCEKRYHCFCAFLAGFKMTLEGSELKGGDGLPVLDCCSSDYTKVGWNRRFKLNYQRCAYYKAQGVSEQLQPSLWAQESHSLLQ